MPHIRTASLFLPFLLAATAAEPPLPQLTVEATDGGSAMRVRNTAAQPLTAYLIELVGYPGSSFSFYREGLVGRSVAPGAEDRIPITNMTVGAAPEYVKLTASLYEDGTSAGTPEKIAQLVGLRRTTLETVRELSARLEKGKTDAKPALVESLRQWAGSIPEPGKRERGTPLAVQRSAQRDLILATAARLETGSVADALNALAASARALASSKPAL